jgi:hypothetical protein
MYVIVSLYVAQLRATKLETILSVVAGDMKQPIVQIPLKLAFRGNYLEQAKRRCRTETWRHLTFTHTRSEIQMYRCNAYAKELQRPILNFAPRGKFCPRGEVVPQW